MAIQATIASIRAPKIHEAIISHEREAMGSKECEEPGQSLLILLGIEAWFAIYLLAQRNGVATALGKLEDYCATLYDMEQFDALELERAQNIVNAVVIALVRAEGQSLVPATPAIVKNDNLSGCSPDLCSTIKENPLLDTHWLTPEERVELAQALETVNSSQTVTPEEVFTGEPFVPVLPPRHIEWEVSAVDCCMWKIPNINNLAPISIAMWQAWGTISVLELKLCREQALNAVTKSDKAPVFVSSWPMRIFGYPKYHCPVAASAKIRGQFVTNSTRPDDHKSKLWNWLRPFLRCSCYKGSSKSGCGGQLIWFNHAVWFMLNHLELFFQAASIQGRLVLLIKFLSGDARKLVLDQISFIYLRQYMNEAALELIAHPEEQFLTKHGDFKGLKTIEALFKPGSFSDKSEKLNGPVKQTINLNTAPTAAPKQRGLYTNNTPHTGRGRGFGRGAALRRPFGRGIGSAQPAIPSAYRTPIGASNSHFAVNIGTVNNEGGSVVGQEVLESPLQRRNIQFQFM
ncbi:unnamed protein product [Calypogeia fissa]